MRIEEAKQIPISEVAEHFGAVLFRENAKDIVYFSPFRSEKTPSFYVRKRLNVYKDHGYHRPQGDTIDLVIDFHDMQRNDPEATKFALNYLERFSSLPRITPAKQEIRVTYSEVYKIKSLSERITKRTLREEIDNRRVGKDLVERYVKQAAIEYNGMKFDTFAFENDKGGHEINNRRRDHSSFKTCIGPKAITTFPAHPEATDVTAFVFTGFWDYLTWLNMNGLPKPNEEYIITNSDSMIGEAGAYIVLKKAQIARVLTFTDHDESRSGERTMHALADILEAEDVHFGSMDHLYDGHKDLSAANMNNRSALQSAYRVSGPTLRPRY